MRRDAMTKIAIVDIESTGQHIDAEDEMIQIAAVIIENGQIVQDYAMFLNPMQSIPSHIVHLTGITDDIVEKAPSFDKVAGLWYQRLKDCIFVAHNLSFDLTILQTKLHALGYEDFNPIAVDTVPLAKIFFPEAPGFNLTELSAYINEPFEQAHNALADATFTAKLLSTIAHRASALSLQDRILLMPFFKALPYQSHYLVSNPEWFLLEHDTDKEVNKLIPPTKLSHFTLDEKSMPHYEAQWINEKLAQFNKIIVENGEYTINAKTKLELWTLLMQKHRMLYILDNESQIENWETILKQHHGEKIMRYRYTHDIVDAYKVYQLFQKVKADQFNVTDLIIALSSYYWLTTTSTGFLSDLNSEINIRDVLSKFGTLLDRRRHTNQFVKQYKRQLSSASIVLMTQAQLYYWLTQHSKPDTLFDTFSLVAVDHLSHLIDVQKQLHQHTFSISQLQVLVKTIYDKLNYLTQFLDQKQLKKQLLKLSELLVTISDMVQFLMSADSTHYATGDWVQSILEYDSIETEGIVRILTVLNETLNSLRHSTKVKTTFSKLNEFEKWQQLVHSQTHLSKILANLSSSNDILVLSGQLLEDGIYQVSLNLKRTYLPSVVCDFLNDATKQVVMLSQGDSHHLEARDILQHVPLECQFITMPKLSITERIELNMLDKSTHTLIKPRDIKTMIDHVAYSDSPLCILIIASSKHEVMNVYRLLTSDASISSDYLILGQGTSGGSLKKLKRRIMTTKRSILIVQRHSVEELQWDLDEIEVQVIIESLPFVSFSDNRVKETQFIYAIEEDFVFEQIVLPEMSQSFIEMITYLDDFIRPSQLTLMDNRLYMKYYGKKILDQWAKYFKFNKIFIN